MNSEEDKPNKFLWLDMEMSGLNFKEDRILEAAAIITDHQLKEIATYESTISHDESHIRPRLEADSFWGQRPEQVEQIIKDMRGGKPEKEVEKDLMTFVKKYYLPGEAIYLAGNSIRVDRAFVDYWWPDFAQLLHYRMLDVTAFKLWWLANGKQEYMAPKEHRAIDDIRRSIAELNFYAKQIK